MRLLALSIAAALNTAPSISFGQATGELEEVRVTGARIRMTDGMATSVPVTSLTVDDLATFEPGGTVAEQLDALPQFFGTGTGSEEFSKTTFTTESWSVGFDLLNNNKKSIVYQYK